MKNENIYLKSGSVLLLIFIIGVIALPLIKIIGLGGYIILGVILFIDLSISIVLIMFGIKELSKNNSDSITDGGDKSFATIISFRRTNIDNISSIYYMIIEYKGESGLTHKSIIPIDYEDYSSCRIGNKIECFIKGEECYIDSENITKVIN